MAGSDYAPCRERCDPPMTKCDMRLAPSCAAAKSVVQRTGSPIYVKEAYGHEKGSRVRRPCLRSRGYSRGWPRGGDDSFPSDVRRQ
jgi:hypothetical protein